MDLFGVAELIHDGQPVLGLFHGDDFVWPDPWTDIWMEDTLRIWDSGWHDAWTVV